MAILVSDTPPAASQDHLSPQQDTFQECGAHGNSGYTYSTSSCRGKLPPGSLDTEVMGERRGFGWCAE